MNPDGNVRIKSDSEKMEMGPMRFELTCAGLDSIRTLTPDSLPVNMQIQEKVTFNPAG